jgi:hypothetical protein
MRRVYSDPQEAGLRGERAAHDIAATLSAKRTGSAMRRRLEELAGSATASPMQATPA